MTPIDDERLMAYLDGELDPAGAAAVEQALVSDEELRDRLAAQRRLRDRLQAHYAPVADEPVPERLRAMLAGDEDKVVKLEEVRRRRLPGWQSVAALAATLVLGLFLGRLLAGEPAPIAQRGNLLIAQGELAEALETRLASDQPADAATRIGVTFARDDGRPCRTFDAAAFSGLACRAGGDWTIVMTTAPEPDRQTEFRQAGSGSAALLAAAQEMMAGEPLDDAAERRARDSGWQRLAATD